MMKMASIHRKNSSNGDEFDGALGWGREGGDGSTRGRKDLGANGWLVGPTKPPSHWFCAFSTLPPPSLAVGYLDLPPRPVAVATYPRQQADSAVDVDPVPTARAGGGRVF